MSMSQLCHVNEILCCCMRQHFYHPEFRFLFLVRAKKPVAIVWMITDLFFLPDFT